MSRGVDHQSGSLCSIVLSKTRGVREIKLNNADIGVLQLSSPCRIESFVHHTRLKLKLAAARHEMPCYVPGSCKSETQADVKISTNRQRWEDMPTPCE